jgi:LysR family transcriptional regulator for metE and metH
VNLEVRHLKLVATVAETGSVTRAGHRLHLTQSALSHQLRAIEEKLGAPLFLRHNKKMTLTQAGERLLSSAQRVIDELHRAEEDIRQIALNREGVLRLSTQCNTCYHWLPAVLRVFNQRFPKVEVRINVEATPRPIEALLEGKLDLAIVTAPVRNQKLVFKPLFQDEMVVVVRPDHPLAARPYVKAADFASEHLIVYAIPKEENTVFQKVLIPAGVSPRQLSQVQLTEAIIEMVKAGIGISVMARWAVAPQIAAGSLRAVPLTKHGVHRRWSAALLRNNSAPAYLHEFVKLLAHQSMPVIAAGDGQAAPK